MMDPTDREVDNSHFEELDGSELDEFEEDFHENCCAGDYYE